MTGEEGVDRVAGLGGGGLPGDTRAGSKAAMAAVAKACKAVTLPASTSTKTSNASGTSSISSATTLYDCQDRSAALLRSAG